MITKMSFLKTLPSAGLMTVPADQRKFFTLCAALAKTELQGREKYACSFFRSTVPAFSQLETDLGMCGRRQKRFLVDAPQRQSAIRFDRELYCRRCLSILLRPSRCKAVLDCLDVTMSAL